MSEQSTILSDMTNTCDCHIHFYGNESQYGRVLDAVYQPPLTTPSDYRTIMDQLSVQRVVVVQSIIYGVDNSCMLAGIAELGQEARGIAVIPTDISENDLDILHRKGIRGVRAFMLEGGVYGWNQLKDLAARISPFKWHLQVQMNGRELIEHATTLSSLNCSLVIDHIGKFMPPVDLDHSSYKMLRKLIETGKCWVKLSAPYESSQTGAPDYEDISILARNLVAAAPERMLWGSNWPHTAQIDLPNEMTLLELLSSWAPSEQIRRKILCSNPEDLYGF
jgi:D-galactarolactone isomerase